jgi:hypothetical protein
MARVGSKLGCELSKVGESVGFLEGWGVGIDVGTCVTPVGSLEGVLVGNLVGLGVST